MSGSVPTVTALGDIYTEQSLDDQRVRWKQLFDQFQSLYGHAAQFVARSPGRVNIIGEHIDYSLYDVLPMAITADIIMAVSTDVDVDGQKEGTYKLRLANIESDRFPPREFDMPYGGAVEIDATKHQWTNYFKSGLRGALKLLTAKHGRDFVPKSMEILINGTVPAGGGLSSSAAFVSTAILAIMIANGEKDMDKKALTQIAIVSERAVGVNSGGMDQAASVFSERGSALLVSFSPTLSARLVCFPKTNPELVFIVAQSFVVSDKQVTGPIHYNLRVVECSMAAAVLNAKYCPGKQLPRDAGPLGISIRGFHQNYFAGSKKSMPEQLTELAELTSSLSKEGYTVDEVAVIMNTTIDDVKARFLSSFPVRASRFKLRQRVLHVFSEALRVMQFLSLLEDQNKQPRSGTADTTEYNKKLGHLMDQTQVSCRDLYECSCPEIDEICTIAKKAGSYGSRLTGAGWGGCSVHLVPADKVDAVKTALMDNYYSKCRLSQQELNDAIVVSRPMNGSAVLTLDAGKMN